MKKLESVHPDLLYEGGDMMKRMPTLQECMDKHKKDGITAVINDGVVVEFKKEEEECSGQES